MSIFAQIFGKPTQAPAQQQQQPNNIQTPPTQTATPNNGTVPNNSVTQQDPTKVGTESGLDQFKGLWDTTATDANKGTAPLFNVDPNKLRELASKGNYLGAVNPEVLQKVAAGGEEAIGALQQLLNGVGAQTFTQSTTATTKLIESALARQREEIFGQLPELIKKQTVSENLREKNPIFNNPATAPLLGAVQQQMQIKFPNASAVELQKMAENYISEFAKAVKGEDTSAATKSQNQEQDWSQFLQGTSF